MSCGDSVVRFGPEPLLLPAWLQVAGMRRMVIEEEEEEKEAAILAEPAEDKEGGPGTEFDSAVASASVKSAMVPVSVKPTTEEGARAKSVVPPAPTLGYLFERDWQRVRVDDELAWEYFQVMPRVV